jgi:hypothetical protein
VRCKPDRVDFPSGGPINFMQDPKGFGHGIRRPSITGNFHALALSQVPQFHYAQNQEGRFPAKEYPSDPWFLSLGMRQLPADETVPQSRPEETFP